MIQRRVRVRGRVQGVGFRVATLHAAAEYPGLRGSVRNLSDGRVEAVFCGDERAVLAMVAWCRRGPSASHVESIEVREEEPDSSLRPFRIDY